MPAGSGTCWRKKRETLKWCEQTSCQVSLPQTQRERSQQGKWAWDTKILCTGEEEGKEQMTSNCPALCSLQVKNHPKKCHSDTHFFFWSSASPVKQPYGTLFTAKCFCPFHFQLPLEMFNVALQNDWQKNSTALFTMVLWCFIEWNHLFRNVFQCCGLDLEFTAAI